MKKFALLLIILMLPALIFAGPRSDTPTLTVYTNSGSDGRDAWLIDRAAQDGFKIQILEAGAANIQNRLIAEQNAPIADVVFGLTPFIWEDLINRNMFVHYVPSWAAQIPAGMNDPRGNFHGIVVQAILLVYDLNQLNAADAPRDWTDLWRDSRFHGRYVYDATFGGATPRMVLSGIISRYLDPNGELGVSAEGWREIEAYIQRGRISESGMDLYARIANRDEPILMGQMWSSGVADRDVQYGTRTGYVVPSVGVPFLVEGVAIINGTRHLAEAQRFVDWFGTPEVQGDWAERFATIPAHPGAAHRISQMARDMAALPPQVIDWSVVGRHIDAWVERIILQYMD